MKPKDPVPVEVFPKLVEAYGSPQTASDNDNLHLIVIALVSYTGFLMPISELFSS